MTMLKVVPLKATADCCESGDDDPLDSDMDELEVTGSSCRSSPADISPRGPTIISNGSNNINSRNLYDKSSSVSQTSTSSRISFSVNDILNNSTSKCTRRISSNSPIINNHDTLTSASKFTLPARSIPSPTIGKTPTTNSIANSGNNRIIHSWQPWIVQDALRRSAAAAACPLPPELQLGAYHANFAEAIRFRDSLKPLGITALTGKP